MRDAMLASAMAWTLTQTADNLDMFGADAKFAADLNRLAAKACLSGWDDETREVVRVANLAVEDYYSQKGRASWATGPTGG